MRQNNKALPIFLLCFFLILPCITSAEELDFVNRPLNTSGLTGLLFTTTPFTLPRNTVEVAASILNESNDSPDFSITEFPLMVSVGLLKNSELALKASYFNIRETSTSGTSSKDRKTGNIELSYKWTFLTQPEDSLRPAFAFIFTGMAPTDNYSDGKVNGVNHWGMRLGLSTGSEISWNDYLIGIYTDIQAQGQDMTQKYARDIFGIWNMGLLFPVSKYRNLQMFVEYTLVFGKDRITLEGGDYSGVTYGIRLVSERFNFTMGTQFKYHQAAGYDNSSRLIGLLSMKI